MNGLCARFPQKHPNSDFAQPGALFRNVMNESDRKHLVNNIVNHLKNANVEIQERQVKIFYKCDPEYGLRVAQGLGIPVTRIKL